MSYEGYGIVLSDNQKEKLLKAYNNNENGSTVRIAKDCYQGNDVIYLTDGQVNKLRKANNEGKGCTIKLSKKQLVHNIKEGSKEGRFLGTLASMAMAALPTVAKTLGIGALGGLADGLVKKLFGSGLYLKKGGCMCEIESDGKGLYLSPTQATGSSSGTGRPSVGSGLGSLGDGLYLGTGHGYESIGRGILLGKNSPFKNIPLLGLLL